MEIASTSVTGFLRFWLLVKSRWWRPRTYRFGEEQALIERWLGPEAAYRRQLSSLLPSDEIQRFAAALGEMVGMRLPQQLTHRLLHAEKPRTSRG